MAGPRAADADSRRGESVNGLLNGLLRAELGMSEEAWKHGEGDGGNL